MTIQPIMGFRYAWLRKGFPSLVAGILVFVPSSPWAFCAERDEILFHFSLVWRQPAFEPPDLIRFLEGFPERILVSLPGLPSGARPMVLVRVPPGSFLLGSPVGEPGRSQNEGPIRGILIDHEILITETEVTQAQWRAVMGTMPVGFRVTGPGVGDDYPMFGISWLDVVGREGGGPPGFLDRLQIRGIGTFRLPSEQEWEFACRAGSQTRFWFGDFRECDSSCGACTEQLSERMIYCKEEEGWEEVGTTLPNPFGLFDMHGNVFEWVQDSYHPSYDGAPSDGSAWEDSESLFRVIRGGDWLSTAAGCRSAVRVPLPPDTRDENVGFRLIKVR